jgi:hypothetical protein
LDIGGIDGGAGGVRLLPAMLTISTGAGSRGTQPLDQLPKKLKKKQ